MAAIADPTFTQRRSADVGRTRRAHKRSALSDCLHSVQPLFKQYNRLDATCTKRISHSTARERSAFIARCIRDLHRVPDEDGKTYRLRDIHNLGNRHVRRLVAIWEKRNYSAGVIQKYLSYLRTLCIWIKKPGMVGDASIYLSDPRRGKRIRIATVDKSWRARGVDTDERIRAVFADDRHVAVCLMLQAEFDLRALEAWLLCAKEALAESRFIVHIRRGAKNGLKRVVEITTPSQRHVLKLAARLANRKTGSQIPTKYDQKQWHDHFYYITRKHGISRQTGIVPHGLRHQGANDLYREMTGFDSPVRSGGVVPPNFDKAKDHAARLRLADHLGHGRKSSSSYYLGSFLKPRNEVSTDSARNDIAEQESAISAKPEITE